MNNFNFVHHPEQADVINLNQVNCFVRNGIAQIEFVFADDGGIWWNFEDRTQREEVFNALLKLTSQNLCTEELLNDDTQQTCRTTQEQSSEKHRRHRETNPF